jgi:heme O synthase-like polyprenyltransferase
MRSKPPDDFVLRVFQIFAILGGATFLIWSALALVAATDISEMLKILVTSVMSLACLLLALVIGQLMPKSTNKGAPE